MNCKELGYKVGDKFEVTKNTTYIGFGLGDIVELTMDDGTCSPKFKSGSNNEKFILLDYVKKIEPGKTLLEILVDELPKRGGWPEGADCITQDPDHEIMPSGCRPEDARWTGSRWHLKGMRTGSFGTGEVILATDYKTAIITRDQYESALAEKNDGWIKWSGGWCPVDEGVLVDVKYRDSSTKGNVPALLRGSGAGRIFWITGCNNSGVSDDIIAYRLSKSKEVDENEYSGEVGGDDESLPAKATIEYLTDTIIAYGCEANLAYPLAKHLMASGLIK